MADTQQTTKTEKSLSQLIAGALMEISPETLKAVSDHPDSPELANRVKQVLGLDKPADVMSPQEQLRYREAVEPETLPAASSTSATAATTTPTTSEEAANIARLQAISDLAEEAQRQAAAPKTTTTKPQESMMEGLPKLLKKVIKQSLTQAETDIKAFKDKVSEDLQQRMK